LPRALLSGNEAVARGAYEAGVRVACAYPGTPSTEILEAIFEQYPEIYCEWSVNEKVALEVAMGASFGGVRALTAMKHVGLNVAADPFFSLAYIGAATGGIVVVSADDPSMHSSQNEQDNRHYGRHAKVPVLEPADSQEAKDFTVWAIKLSEQFDTPVLLRLTTRISHSKSVVELSEPMPPNTPTYEKNITTRMILPVFARKLHIRVEERLKKLAEWAEDCPINVVEMRDKKIGIVTCGVTYQHVREVAPEASVLKLGMVYPVPPKLVKKFAESVKELYVVEELDPFLEMELNHLGIFPKKGKGAIPILYELNPERVEAALKGQPDPIEAPIPADIPTRPAVLCPGCPHTGVFYNLHKMKATVTGDIGCYTLGGLPPLSAMDTCVCMGASVGNALGLEKAMGEEVNKNIFAVIGESTFIHSGITGLINSIYNLGHTKIVILDNRITAMTGHQHNPSSGKTLRGETTHELDLEALAKVCGAKYVAVVDPYNLDATRQALEKAQATDGVAVVISRRHCALLVRKEWKPALSVDVELCNGCRLCLQVGCPAISMKEKKAVIDPVLCTGCGVCAQVCPEAAILEKAVV
jgi:indolepyruvate ferredoxin oxidoreductase alpha subunit